MLKALAHSPDANPASFCDRPGRIQYLLSLYALLFSPPGLKYTSQVRCNLTLLAFLKDRNLKKK